MITGKPLFPGRTIKDQLSSIFKFNEIESQKEYEELINLPSWDPSFLPQEFKVNEGFYSQFTKESKDLFEKMFKLNPSQRISSFEALIHPYFENVKLPSFLEKIEKSNLDF